MRSYNSSLDYDRSVMILPSMRPSMTTTQQQPSNFDSLTLLPSFFPKNKQPSSYDQPGSKHREVIEIIEPDLEDFGDYKLTKKVKPDSNSVNKTAYPNVQNNNQSGPIYAQDPRQYNHRPDFAPRPVDKPNVQIIELDESDDDVEDHNNRQVLNSQEKLNRQKPINISINDSNNVTQGNGHHPYHYQNIAGYSMPKRPLLSHHEIFSDTPLSPSNSDSSSSPFYSPTNHEFLAELDSRVDEQPLTPSRPQETQGTSLNAKRVFGYDQGEFSPKVKVVERIHLDEDDAIVISECESDEEDYQQTECTYIGLESRHVSVVDSVVSKPSQQEERLKPLGAILSPLQTEEKPIQIKIKTSQEKSKKLAKKRQVKQKEAVKEGSKMSKEVESSSLPKKKKVKKTQTELLLSENAEPSYKKTSRGLNKLQLFRYQMDVVIDEDEALDKISFFESEAKPEQLLKITKSDSKKDLYTDQVATIPPLDKRVNNKRKGPLVPLWDPQDVKENELNDYLKQLKQIVRETIIDEERAFRLLKVFNLSTKLTMDEVKTNMTYYKEILTQRFRKFKRRIS